MRDSCAKRCAVFRTTLGTKVKLQSFTFGGHALVGAGKARDGPQLTETSQEETSESTRTLSAMPNETPKKRCKYKSGLTGWQCPRQAWHPSEYCICHKHQDDKPEKWFLDEIDKILKDEKSEAYHFEGFYFPFEMDFSVFKFRKDTYFTKAIFKKDVSFSVAQFSGEETSFSWAKFSGQKTSFSWAKFPGERTSFYSAKFLAKETFFSGAQFSGKETDFTWAQFSGNLTDFAGAKISDFLRFSETRFQSKETKVYYLELGENAKLIFVNTLFEESNKNNLTKIDLSKCLFQETNLEYCDLSLAPMNWKTKLLNDGLKGKEYEEISGESEKTERFSWAAESYRMLKVNFSKRQDYGKAAICHFREWECRRKALNLKTPVGLITSFFYWLLRCSCGYGEKLQNVLGFTVFLFLLFSLIFSFTPLIPAGDDPSTLQEIDNSLRGRNAPAIPLWNKLQGALKYTFFHLLPLWRFSDLRAATDFGNIMSGVMTVAGAFMIGLFIYVFRRRLMR